MRLRVSGFGVESIANEEGYLGCPTLTPGTTESESFLSNEGRFTTTFCLSFLSSGRLIF